ncbi:hypothetical protein D3C76_1450040 [compost metagenome]
MLASIDPEHRGQAGGPEDAFLVALEGTAGFCLNHALQVDELHFHTATVSVRSALPEPEVCECELEEVAAVGLTPVVLNAL